MSYSIQPMYASSFVGHQTRSNSSYSFERDLYPAPMEKVSSKECLNYLLPPSGSIDKSRSEGSRQQSLSFSIIATLWTVSNTCMGILLFKSICSTLRINCTLIQRRRTVCTVK